jgi:proteic killer suppression protein
MGIRDYRDKRTAAFVQGERISELEQCAKQATKVIAKLQSATRLIELRRLPSNYFEALQGTRRGQFSIRIDGKWRICFRWAPTEDAPAGRDQLFVQGEPYDVEITNHYD